MSKKLICLASFILAVAIGNVGQADLPEWEAAINGANPLHWYKFNEATGTDCFDSGSSGLNGTYDGVLLSQDGYFGTGAAVRFDRSAANVVNFTGATNISGSWTAEYIIRNMKAPSGYDPEALHDNTGGTSIRVAGSTSLGEAGYTQYGIADYRFTPAGGLTLDDLIVPEGEWIHLVWRNDAGNMALFFNGKLMGANPAGIDFPRERIGAGGTGADALNAFVDEAVVFDRALADVDIVAHAQSASLLDPFVLRASNPDPTDSSVLTSFPGGILGKSLMWTPGPTAASHDVYFGTDYAEVEAGTGETFRGNQSGKYFLAGYGYTPNDPCPTGFVPGTTYYWRIDEVEADEVTKYHGDIWSFEVASSKAYNPTPIDGAKFADTDTDLTWEPGLGVIMQTLYFGDDYDTVNSATTNGTDIGGGLTYDPGPLELGTAYYWRVDTTGVFGEIRGDVWSFTTLPVIPITDPNLVGWWKFDAGSGTTAIDWSGHENHGTLNGPQWMLGYDGDALEFDGTNDTVSLGTGPALDGPTDLSVAAWIKTSTASAGVIIQQRNGGWNGEYRFMVNGSGQLDFMLYGDSDYQYTFTTTKTVNDDNWHHVVAIRQGQNGYIYVDGRLEASDTGTIRSLDSTIQVAIGADVRDSVTYFNGTIDDVRIYNKALTQEEVKQAMRGDPLLAWDPSPMNGSTPDIDEALPLSWSPGEKASQHDVYFGVDKEAVEFADISDTTGIYRIRQSGTNYTHPEGVEWGFGPYYWRIDEYNTDGIISKGRVWSFTVADFISIDNIEGYDAENQIWYNWLDGLGYVKPDTLPHPGNGTGSEVGDGTTASFTEETIVHGGGQSMPFKYNNNDPFKLKYSEAKLTLSTARDWTKHGVKALSLWFHGDSANTPEQMYLAVANSTGTPVVIPYAGDADDLKKVAWQEWNIDLREFSNAGLNLADVNSFAIGFGNRNNPQIGGSGKMYFDDIRLYRARCVSSLLKPDADLSGDCVVNIADFGIMASNWLISTYQVSPVDPGTANLAGHWTFDDPANLGADSMGNNDGMVNGQASQSTNAKVGFGSLALDGEDDFINVAGGEFFSALDDDGDGLTVAAWVQFALRGQASLMRVFSTNMSGGGSGGWGFGIIQPPASLRFTTYGIQDYDTRDLSSHLPDGQWIHVAAVYKSDGNVDFYIDGALAETIEGNFSMNDTQGFLIGGLAAPTATEWFEGLIDDLRIYDRELSQGEVGWLTGKTTPYLQDLSLSLTPPDPAINAYDDDTIDFKDLAILADQWLDELLWPQP